MSPQQDVASARPVVVIVDDDPAIRNSLAFSLRTEGIAVMAYASGAELLQKTFRPGPSCLVIDYKLPGMNGLDLLAELRRRKVRDAGDPHHDASQRRRTRTRDRDRHPLIEKPLLGDALFQEIRAALAA